MCMTIYATENETWKGTLQIGYMAQIWTLLDSEEPMNLVALNLKKFYFHFSSHYIF